MTTASSQNQSLSVEEIAKNLNTAGIPPEFGEGNSRILIRTLRALTQGKPVTETDVVQFAEELGTPFEKVDEFLTQVTERDADNNIIGSMGLSLNQEWSHRFEGKVNRVISTSFAARFYHLPPFKPG